jgi:hypothetical protein
MFNRQLILEPAFSRFVLFQAQISICAGCGSGCTAAEARVSGAQPPAIRNRRLVKHKPAFSGLGWEPASSRFDPVQVQMLILLRLTGKRLRVVRQEEKTTKTRRARRKTFKGINPLCPLRLCGSIFLWFAVRPTALPPGMPPLPGQPPRTVPGKKNAWPLSILRRVLRLGWGQSDRQSPPGDQIWNIKGTINVLK